MFRSRATEFRHDCTIISQYGSELVKTGFVLNCIIEFTAKVSCTAVQDCYRKKYCFSKSQNLFTHPSVTPVVLPVYINLII